MIDIKELRRLAQAATPGGWYVERGNYVYGCKEVTDGEEAWHPVIACTDDDEVSINFEGNANFIAAANPAVINELLDRLEESESDCLEQARLNGMGASREAALMAKLEAAERDRATFIMEIGNLCTKVEALREQLSKQRSLSQAAQHLAEVAQRRADALRARIEEMERQEPVAWMDKNGTLYNTVSHVRASDKPLYLAPGAKGE